MRIDDLGLRIGNLVEEPKGHTHKVERTSENSTRKRYAIPLTEEWLTKLEFKKILKFEHFEDFHHPYWVNNGVVLLFNSSPPENTYKCGYAEMRNGKYYVVTSRWINSVHQLQNLYYSLIGEELTINQEREP